MPARIGGVGLHTIRDRVLRFNARGPDGLKDGMAGRAPARPLVQMVEEGPNLIRLGGVRKSAILAA